MSEVVRLSEEEVLRVRRRLASTRLAKKSTFGAPEPLSFERLSSAVNRQWTAHGKTYKYGRMPEIAATLFYGLTMGHAFENGNKRTAMIALFVLLDKNRFVLINTSEDELYRFAESVASHTVDIPTNKSRNSESEVDGVRKWLRKRIKPIFSGDKRMKFSNLREHLLALGCTFDNPSDNYIRIHNGSFTVKTGYPRAEFTVAVNEVKRIRKGLHLDAWHGVDDHGFYDLESRVDVFFDRHINLMRRLADL